MQDYKFNVTVTAASPEQAWQIMRERINHDEDLSEYGIEEYRIGFDSGEGCEEPPVSRPESGGDSSMEFLSEWEALSN